MAHLVAGSSNASDSGQRRLTASVRIFVLCVCLTLALIAANLTYSMLAQPTEALAGRDGALLYVSAFSAYSEDWDLFAGRQSARIVAEQLEISVADTRTAAWSASSPRFADFDVSVSASAIAGPLDNAFGLVFHVEEAADDSCTLPAILLCGIGELSPLAGAALRQAFDRRPTTSYKAFMISSDGYYSLWRTEDGAANALSGWIASPHINQGIGAENAIRILSRGSRYQFFINDVNVSLCIPDDVGAASTYSGGECVNGSMLDTYRDEMNRSGKIGLIAQSTATGGGGVVVRFDDMIVYSPAETGRGDARL